MKAAMAKAKPIASPLSVSGLSAPLAKALTAAAAKAGRPVLAVPPGPLGSFPPQTLQPGSAVAVGYSNGDVRTSATGTVAYVDGDRIWIFGHELEGNGRRALLLQDAYVFRIINNPLQLGAIASTYKLAASGHDLGTITSDGFSAVAGRIGALPHTVPITAIARDEDADKRHHRQHERRRRGGRGPAQRRRRGRRRSRRSPSRSPSAACSAARPRA